MADPHLCIPGGLGNGRSSPVYTWWSGKSAVVSYIQKHSAFPTMTWAISYACCLGYQLLCIGPIAMPKLL